jgi:stage V sporulation protein B
LLRFWAGNNPEKACQSVVMGSGVSACMTLSCLTTLRLLERSKHNTRIPIAKRLTKTAIPLAVADDLRTGIATVENLIVPKRLSLYPGVISPLAEFGTVCGMVFPILMFPAALLFGLTELLVPELARCRAAGSNSRIRYLARKSLRIALLYGVICAGILFLTAPALCQALYSNANAGKYLRWFAPLAVLLYCDCVTDAMIKGLGQQTASVRYNILTNTMDVILLYILLPRYGVAGYFISFLVTHLLNFVLSIRRLMIILEERINIAAPAMVVAASLVAVWIAGFTPTPLSKSFSYAVILICLLFLLNVLKKEDILWLKGLINKK